MSAKRKQLKKIPRKEAATLIKSVMSAPMSGGEFLCHRKDLGWSQQFTAEQLGYTHEQGGSMISKWEKDIHPIPSPVAILMRLWSNTQ